MNIFRLTVIKFCIVFFIPLKVYSQSTEIYTDLRGNKYVKRYLELIKLDTNDGNICIKGKINSVTYLEGIDGDKDNGFFSKLFK